MGPSTTWSVESLARLSPSKPWGHATPAGSSRWLPLRRVVISRCTYGQRDRSVLCTLGQAQLPVVERTLRGCLPPPTAATTSRIATAMPSHTSASGVGLAP
jgi:hypothetical protein